MERFSTLERLIPNEEHEDGFVETSTPHGDIIVVIARGVGFLVAIVAIILAILVMMLLKAFIVYNLHKLGVSGVIIVIALFTWSVIKFGHISSKIVWTMLARSCS
jgi:hypothetical protein